MLNTLLPISLSLFPSLLFPRIFFFFSSFLSIFPVRLLAFSFFFPLPPSSPMGALCDDILGVLAFHLSFLDLSRLSCVSKRLRDFCSTPIAKQYIDAEDCVLFNDSIARLVLSNARPVELRLAGCVDISDATLDFLASSPAICSRLQVLR